MQLCSRLSRRSIIATGLATVCGFTAIARAAEPIVVTAETTGGSTITADSDHLLTITREVTERTGPFAGLGTSDFTANYKVGNASNVLRITSANSGTSLTLTEPRGGVSQSFNAATASENADNLNDYLKHDLNGPFAGYQKSVDQFSTIGVADGNPHAVTAILADDAYTQFGLNPALPPAPTAQLGAFSIGATGGGGIYHTTGLNADFADLDVTVGMRLGDRIGLTFSSLFEYDTLGGDSRYMGGYNVGLPITIFHDPPTGGAGIAWQITPWGTIGGGGDPNLVLGGGVAGGGGTSVVRLINGPFSLAIIDQGEYVSGFDIDVDGYNFDDKVDQYIIKNGLLGTYLANNGLFIDAGASYTDFLRAAGVRDYLTPTLGGGIAWGHERESSFRLAYEGDFGKGYSGEGLTLQLRFGF